MNYCMGDFGASTPILTDGSGGPTAQQKSAKNNSYDEYVSPALVVGGVAILIIILKMIRK